MANILPISVVVLLIASSAMGASTLKSFPEFVSGSHCAQALTLTNAQEVQEAQGALFNVNTATGWILLGYNGPNSLILNSAGEGGPEEVVPKLVDNQVLYGVIRFGNVPAGGVKVITRDVFFSWVGPNVKPADKKTHETYGKQAQKFLQPYTANSEITVLKKNLFTRDQILEKSNPAAKNRVIG